MSSRGLLGSPTGGPAGSPGFAGGSEGGGRKRASMISRHSMVGGAGLLGGPVSPPPGANLGDIAPGAKPKKAKKAKVKKIALPGEDLGYPLYHAITGNLPVVSKQFHISSGGGGDGDGSRGPENADYGRMTGNLPVLSKELLLESGDSLRGKGAFDDEDEMMPGWVELRDPVTRKAFWWNVYYRSYRDSKPSSIDDGRRGSKRSGGERAMYKNQYAHLRALVLEKLTLEELKGPGESEVIYPDDDTEEADDNTIPGVSGNDDDEASSSATRPHVPPIAAFTGADHESSWGLKGGSGSSGARASASAALGGFDPEAPVVTKGQAKKIARVYDHYIRVDPTGLLSGPTDSASAAALAAITGAVSPSPLSAVGASKRRLLGVNAAEPALLPDGTVNPKAGLTKSQLILGVLPPQFSPLFFLSPVVLARMKMVTLSAGAEAAFAAAAAAAAAKGAGAAGKGSVGTVMPPSPTLGPSTKGGAGSSSRLPPLLAAPMMGGGGGQSPTAAAGSGTGGRRGTTIPEEEDERDDDYDDNASTTSGKSQASGTSASLPKHNNNASRNSRREEPEFDEIEVEEEKEVEVEVEVEELIPDPNPPPPPQPVLAPPPAPAAPAPLARPAPLSFQDEATLHEVDGEGSDAEDLSKAMMWAECYSYAHLRCFYVHRPTRTSTWTAPAGDDYQDDCSKHERLWELRWDGEKSAPYFVLRSDTSEGHAASRKEKWTPAFEGQRPPAGYQANGYPEGYDGAVPEDYWVAQDAQLPAQGDTAAASSSDELQSYTFYWNLLSGARQWDQPANWPRPMPDSPPPAVPPSKANMAISAAAAAAEAPAPAPAPAPPQPPKMIAIKKKVKKMEKRMVKTIKRVPRPPRSSSSSSSSAAPPSPSSSRSPASVSPAASSSPASGSPPAGSAAAAAAAAADAKKRRGTAASLASAIFGGGSKTTSAPSKASTPSSALTSPGSGVPAIVPAPTKPLGPPPLIDPEALLTFFEFFTGTANAPDMSLPSNDAAGGAGGADGGGAGAEGILDSDDDSEIDETTLVYPDHRGYLRKKGGGTSWLFGRRNWKERFFVFQRGVLSYYNNQEEWEKGKDPIKHIRIAVKYYRVDPRAGEPTLFSLVPDYTVEDNESTGEGLRVSSSKSNKSDDEGGKKGNKPGGLTPILSGRVLKDSEDGNSSSSDKDDDDDEETPAPAPTKVNRLQRSLSRAQIETEVATESGGLSKSGAKSLLDRRVFHFEAPSQEAKAKWIKVLRGRRMDGKHRADSPEFEELYAAVAAARKAMTGPKPPPGFGGF